VGDNTADDNKVVCNDLVQRRSVARGSTSDGGLRATTSSVSAAEACDEAALLDTYTTNKGIQADVDSPRSETIYNKNRGWNQWLSRLAILSF
jgi:hypothetical protein